MTWQYVLFCSVLHNPCLNSKILLFVSACISPSLSLNHWFSFFLSSCNGALCTNPEAVSCLLRRNKKYKNKTVDDCTDGCVIWRGYVRGGTAGTTQVGRRDTSVSSCRSSHFLQAHLRCPQVWCKTSPHQVSSFNYESMIVFYLFLCLLT